MMTPRDQPLNPGRIAPGVSDPASNSPVNTAISPFDPVTIGPLTLRNRFIKSGANEAMCLDGKPTRALLRHHSDLARGFVRAEIMAVDDLLRLGSERELKAAGLNHIVGKDYIVKDGDVIHFRFNV